ncbi:MAG: dolichyl-phosphate beta-glucosyltransferase [Mycobacteriaceae bacterium]
MSTASTPGYQAYRLWAQNTLTVRPQISVVVPTYNEEIRILPTVGAIATHMSSRSQPWELIIADDGSTDRTVGLLSELGLANMKVLVAERNGGKGSAVRRGIQAARGDFVLFADADQSTPIEQIEQFLAECTSGGCDVVIGSRAVAGSAVRGKSLLRRILSRGLRTFVFALTGLRITDTQCGFKLFTAQAAQQLFSSQVVDGFSFDLEVLYLAKKAGLKVREVPVQWYDAPGSTVAAAKVSLQFVAELIRIRTRDMTGRYDNLGNASRMTKNEVTDED